MIPLIQQHRQTVDKVIDLLNEIEVDGETMQYILKNTGMEWQMLRQLMLTRPKSQIQYLIEERDDLGL